MVARARTPVAAAFAVLGLGWLAFVTWLVAVGPGDHPWRDDVLYFGLMFGAGALTLVRAARRRTDRVVWAAVGLALVFATAGDVLYMSGDGSRPSWLWEVAEVLFIAY